MRHEDTALLHVRVMSSLDGWWKQTGDALYLRNGIIERIGNTADIREMASSTSAQVLDFSGTPGATCYPAFMDSHLHLDLYGFSLLHVNLNGETSLDGALERIRLAGRPDNGTWICGDCWDDELWSDSPHRRQLALTSFLVTQTALPASSAMPLRTGPFPAFPPPGSTNGSLHFTAPSANCSRWDLPHAAAWIMTFFRNSRH